MPKDSHEYHCELAVSSCYRLTDSNVCSLNYRDMVIATYSMSFLDGKVSVFIVQN